MSCTVKLHHGQRRRDPFESICFFPSVVCVNIPDGLISFSFMTSDLRTDLLMSGIEWHLCIRIVPNRFNKMKIEISSISSSEMTFESLETISGPISWFECSIRVSGTPLARFHSYFQNPSWKFMVSSSLCPLKYSLDRIDNFHLG